MQSAIPFFPFQRVSTALSTNVELASEFSELVALGYRLDDKAVQLILGDQIHSEAHLVYGLACSSKLVGGAEVAFEGGGLFVVNSPDPEDVLHWQVEPEVASEKILAEDLIRVAERSLDGMRSRGAAVSILATLGPIYMTVRSEFLSGFVGSDDGTAHDLLHSAVARGNLHGEDIDYVERINAYLESKSPLLAAFVSQARRVKKLDFICWPRE